MENTEENHREISISKTCAQLQNIKVHVYNGKSDQNVLPITYNMMP